MKKLSLLKLLIIVCFATFFSGCSKVEELSEERTEVVVTYLANVVDKFNVDSDYKLVKVKSDIDKDDKKNEKISGKKENEVHDLDVNINGSKNNIETDNTDITNATFGEVLGYKNLKVKQKSAEYMDSYKKDFLLIEPKKDCKLLKVDLKITNNSSSTSKIQLASKNIDYCLKNDSCSFLPLKTLDENDIMFFEVELKPNKSKYATLFFEVDKNLGSEEMKLEAKSGEKRCELQVSVNQK